jgi:septal ring factor EnvC (AmiA/AmiB activator)
MNKFTTLSMTAALALSLGACVGSGSSTRDTGERMTQRGGEIAQYGDQWTAGNKDVRNGEKLIAKSSRQIDDARKKLSKAEADQAKARQMIAEGTIKMQSSEADYAAARTGPAAITIPQSE